MLEEYACIVTSFGDRHRVADLIVDGKLWRKRAIWASVDVVEQKKVHRDTERCWQARAG
jgi:hypothetical protein